MKQEASQRWVLSFADLTLLLLAFFIMMQAQAGDRMKLAAGIRTAFGGKNGGEEQISVQGFSAARAFHDAEAILKPGEAERFKAIGAEAARAGYRVIVSSQGRDGQSARLDSWELAAARTTAVARAIRAGGLPDAKIEIAIPPMRASEAATGQRISVQQISGPRP